MNMRKGGKKRFGNSLGVNRHLASLVKRSNLQVPVPWAEPCWHDDCGPMRRVHLRHKNSSVTYRHVREIWCDSGVMLWHCCVFHLVRLSFTLHFMKHTTCCKQMSHDWSGCLSIGQNISVRRHRRGDRPDERDRSWWLSVVTVRKVSHRLINSWHQCYRLHWK